MPVEETLGAEFVEVPLNVILAYWFRDKRFACMVPVRQRLAWLQSRDTDRSVGYEVSWE